jgi:hypothetical protein
VVTWSAFALADSYELLVVIIRRAQTRTVTPSAHAEGYVTDPLQERAAVGFVADLTADRVPSVRAIRAALHVGQPRAQRLREYLTSVAGGTPNGTLAA